MLKNFKSEVHLFLYVRKPRAFSFSQSFIFSFLKMSKQHKIVPKLDEIMAQFKAGKEETTADPVEKVPEKEPQMES